MNTLSEIAQALHAGDDRKTALLTQQAVAEGISAREILDRALIAGMNIIGEQFKNQELFLPEVLLAARAMNAGIEILKPQLLKDNVPSRGRIVIGTVQGDMHDIGKNLVGIMLKGAGFEVIDLGSNVAPEKFVETAVKENASVIGISALLTTTMPGMKKTIDLIKAQGLSGKIKVIIGGAPITQEYARSIGADGYGYDAANAVEQVKRLLG